MTLHTTLFRIAAILWFLWGLVHLFAGVMTVSQPTGAGFSGILDAMDPEVIQAVAYPEAVGGILKQHGWNLGWIGLTTMLCSWWVAKGNREAVLLAALVGGLADVGYFLFLDVPGYVNFVPGTVMTLFSAAAVVLSFYAAFSGSKRG